MIDAPGVYDIPIADYLGDPCPEPSFSASIGKTLLQMTPKHAWLAHPRLGNADRDDRSLGSDFGSVVHELVLGNGSAYKVLEVDDFRKKAAQEAKAEAIAEGLTPIKAVDFERAQAAAESIRRQVPDVFAEGEAERTMIWRDGPAWCRARPDWLRPEAPMVFDLKITGINLSPRENAVQRHIFAMWYDMTAAHYIDGYRELFGQELEYRFLFVENKPPFFMRPFKLSGMGLEMGERKLRVARAWWKRHMETNHWPLLLELDIADPEPWQAAGWLTHEDGPSGAEVDAALEMYEPLEAVE